MVTPGVPPIPHVGGPVLPPGCPTVLVASRLRVQPTCASFRELPALATGFEKLTVRPDLVICDGQGIAHPRRFGLACHLGLIYGLAVIGCAKTCLVGEASEPGFTRGSFTQLVTEGETAGVALRTRDGVKPLYVSPGHLISLRTAGHWILALSSRHRIPEPTRMADQQANKMKRGDSGFSRSTKIVSRIRLQDSGRTFVDCGSSLS